MSSSGKNASGYADPTAGAAIESITSEERERTRIDNLMKTINYICRLAGFRIDGRIVLVDRKNGRVWR